VTTLGKESFFILRDDTSFAAYSSFEQAATSRRAACPLITSVFEIRIKPRSIRALIMLLKEVIDHPSTYREISMLVMGESVFQSISMRICCFLVSFLKYPIGPSS